MGKWGNGNGGIEKQKHVTQNDHHSGTQTIQTILLYYVYANKILHVQHYDVIGKENDVIDVRVCRWQWPQRGP